MNYVLFLLVLGLFARHSASVLVRRQQQQNVEEPGKRLLPEKLHVTSYVTLQSEDTPDTYNWYTVDEYVELPSKRSSISLYDLSTGETQIYYNQINVNKLEILRKFLRYDVSRSECRLELIYSWQLAVLRRTAIGLGGIPDDSSRVDVSIGPSTLLYAVESRHEEFKFIRKIMSSFKQTFVDVYRAFIGESASDPSQRLEIIVHVVQQGNHEDKKPGDSLAVNEAKALRIWSICVRRSVSQDDELANEDKYEKLDDTELDCEAEGSFIVHVYYGLVSEIYLTPESLLGQRLEQVQEYNFEKDPFMPPVGIGCWPLDTSETLKLSASRWQRALVQASRQMSAEYVTQYGTREVAYVAYDAFTGLARVDRNRRKNVYDLNSKLSYHSVQWHESQVTKLSNSSALANNENERDQCVVLKQASWTSAHDIVGHMIGLYGGKKAHYLGSKLIDHTSYEVFETELGANAVPLVLEVAHWRLSSMVGAGGNGDEKSGNARQRRLYLTFYMQEFPDLTIRRSNDFESSASAIRGGSSSSSGGAELSKEQLVPKYIELWHYDPSALERRIVNRVEFTQFSWRLDVDPSNDPESQYGLGRVFDVRQCYEDLSQQADLMVRMIQLGKQRITGQDQLNGLKKQRSYIAEMMHAQLTTRLEIPRLNMGSLDVRISNSGNMIVSARLTELVSGVSSLVSLGKTYFPRDSSLDNYLIRMLNNRHSLDDCQLDSYGWWEDNWLAYCPRLSVCILFKQDKDLKAKLAAEEKKEGKKVATNDEADPNEDLCDVYDFRWARHGQSSALHRSDGVIVTAESNLERLNNFEVNFRFRYRQAETRKLIVRDYSSHFVSKRFTKLSQIDSRSGAQLDGLAFVETNAQQQVQSSFRSCLLACQMDDQCASFSYCALRTAGSAPANNNGDAECILSKVRLTKERVQRMISMAAKQAQFRFKVISESHSMAVLIKRDSSCSMHEKDFITNFAVMRVVSQLHETPTRDANERSTLAPSVAPAGQLPSVGEKQKRAAVSLQDCAGQSYELNLFLDLEKARFAYCPLTAACFINANAMQVLSAISTNDGPCYMYSKSMIQFYQGHIGLRLAVYDDKSMAKEQLPVSVEHGGASSDPKQQAGVARTFYGLSDESCARDCNMHRTRCLAFDSCRDRNGQVCFLYTIRSPEAPPTSARLPALSVEKQFRYNSDSQMDSMKPLVRLVQAPVCTHFSLKPGYFDARLEQMQSDDQLDTPKNVDADDREQKQLDADQKTSDDSLKQIKQGLMTQGDNQQGLSSHRRISWKALLVGILLSSLGMMYKQQIVVKVINLYMFVKMRRGAHANDGLNQLVLNEDA